MTCWQCGGALPPDVGFCRGCGALVRPRSAPIGAVTEAAAETQLPALRQTIAPPAPVSAHAWPVQAQVLAPTAVPAEVQRTGTDLLCAAGSGLVVLSVFLTWYSVTVTALGVRFYASLEQAFLSKLFPQIAAGLGNLRGPLTTSVSALGQGAGGWRWAILVVSIVIVLETLVVVTSARPNQLSGWPHAGIQVMLTIANVVLVLAAFFTLPYGNAPSGYITVARGPGAYLGLFAALFALGCALTAALRRQSPSPSR